MTSTICKVTNKFVVVEKVFILVENYSRTHRYAINVGLHILIDGVDTWWPTCSLQTRKTSVHLWCVKYIHVCLVNLLTCRLIPYSMDICFIKPGTVATDTTDPIIHQVPYRVTTTNTLRRNQSMNCGRNGDYSL